MTTRKTLFAHLSTIYNLLLATYGVPEWVPDKDPLGGLVRTILSQHTTDVHAERAYKLLITRFPTWEEVRIAPWEEIAEVVRHSGLANIKARRIQNALHTLTDQKKAEGRTEPLSEYLYNELTKRSPQDAWYYLRSITGVGPKTAACVLMFHMGIAIMPVDTHVFRVSRRLGLIGQKENTDQVHDFFASITPPEWIYTLHMNLIQHGRQVCHAVRPKCDRCALYSECAYVGSMDGREISN